VVRDGRKQRAGARRVITLDRRARAIALRRERKTYNEIGAALGISRHAAWKLVMGAVDDLNEQLIEETRALRQEQLDRAQALLGAIWPGALKGEVQKIDRVVKLWERMAKLGGLDAAEKYEHAGAGGGPIQVSELRGKVAEKIASLRAKGTPDGSG
jgi:hypothetical protein